MPYELTLLCGHTDIWSTVRHNVPYVRCKSCNALAIIVSIMVKYHYGDYTEKLILKPSLTKVFYSFVNKAEPFSDNDYTNLYSSMERIYRSSHRMLLKTSENRRISLP